MKVRLWKNGLTGSEIQDSSEVTAKKEVSVSQVKGEKFIFLADEWDCIFRIRRDKKEEQEEFLEFLRTLFKDKAYLELVYMTGILPIKKYNTGSALNMFREFTMLSTDSSGIFDIFEGRGRNPEQGNCGRICQFCEENAGKGLADCLMFPKKHQCIIEEM